MPKPKIKVKSGGQECPPHTLLKACEFNHPEDGWWAL